MTIVQTPNKHARQYVQQRRNFIGSNMKGHWEPSGVYAVYSYGYHFPMWVYDPAGGWFGNMDKYSRTTSKHQSQTHPDEDIHWLPTQALLYIIKVGFKQVLVNRILHGVRYEHEQAR